MPEVPYAFLCDYVRAEPGLIHALGVGIDTISVGAVPSGHHLGLGARVTFTRAECSRPHRVEIIVQGEDGDRLAEMSTVVTPTWPAEIPEGWPTNMMVGLNFGTPLPRYGLYSVELLVNDTNKATLPFRVVPPRTAQ